MRYAVRIHLVITGEDPGAIERALDEVMEELVHLAEVDSRFADPSIGADLGDGTVEFALTVDAEEGYAVPVALAAIRSAIHKAGGGTQAWPTFPPAEAIEAKLVGSGA
jgi:hypothetical protein